MQCLIDFISEGQAKTCRVCKEDKILQEFYPNKACKLGVTGTCRDCSRVRLTAWYKSTQSVRQKRANDYNKAKKKMLVDHFNGTCLDCKGVFPQCVYQFHHLDPSEKDMNPSLAILMGETKMWKEINKCVMLCANCHMIRHHGGDD